MVHIMSFFLTINYAFNVFLRMKEKKDRLYGNSMEDDSVVCYDFYGQNQSNSIFNSISDTSVRQCIRPWAKSD